MTTETLLMVDPVGDQIFPLSPRAFQAIRAPVARTLARNCVALFLDAAGSVQRIESIKQHRKGPVAMLRPYLGLSEPADFIRSAIDAPIDDVRTMILDAMMFMRQRESFPPDAWWLYTAPEPKVRAALAEARTLAELHRALRLPADKDCLDVL